MKAKVIDIARGNHPGLAKATLKARFKNLVNDLKGVEFQFRMAIRDHAAQSTKDKLGKQRKTILAEMREVKAAIAAIE